MVSHDRVDLPYEADVPDPIFFLHHTQVDRLWTLWQQERPDRVRAYGGLLNQWPATDNATLSDRMSFLGLGPDVKVSEAMSTKSSRFCYEYDS